MADLEAEYLDLREEIRVGSIANHELPISEFFGLFSAIAAENGDSPDLEYYPVLREGSGGYRLDGAALDLLDAASGDSADLYLAVCDFRQDENLPSFNARDVDRAVDGVERFFRAVASNAFIDSLEESSPAYQVAILIRANRQKISRLRVLVLTNAHLRTRRNAFETRDVDGIALHVNVLDLERYARIASSGTEPVEFDLDHEVGGPIECLSVDTGTDDYESYLLALPGVVLAKIFAAFGNRLLEQNVRTYLQARTNVNKGILKTIGEEAGMFFAYNNGITATASSVATRRMDNGALGITHVRDFQIVNGGQTTASLLYARDAQKLDLDHVHVQVKLSVISPDRLEEVVPLISEYANTQNKVSMADLASNKPVQIRIERLSREVSAPQRAGELHNGRWFYERARGQYKNLFAYKPASERRKLELMYPKRQLVTKTDLAKYELSFDGRPHHVCEGAQKCFNRYWKTVLSPLGDGSGLTTVWFQRAMAKAILFQSVDSAVQRSDWYLTDRGYKAQIVAYAVAACADRFRDNGYQIDLDRIWRNQEVPQVMVEWMLAQAIDVAKILKNPPQGVRNISEFAKKEFCWELHVKGRVGTPPDEVQQHGITLEEFYGVARQGDREEARNRDVDFDILVARIMPRITEIRRAAEAEGLASPKNMNALAKLQAGRLNLARGERNALKALLGRLDISP